MQMILTRWINRNFRGKEMGEQGILRKDAGGTFRSGVSVKYLLCLLPAVSFDGTRPYALCDSCMKKMHWNNGRTCEKCGKALPETYRGGRCYSCMESNHSFRKGYSCLTYGLYEREMILDYKYNGKGYLGKKFGDILSDRIRWENLKIDVIIPIPIHRTRERKRGYNQTELMAARLAQLWGKTADAGCFAENAGNDPAQELSPD